MEGAIMNSYIIEGQMMKLSEGAEVRPKIQDEDICLSWRALSMDTKSGY